MKFTVKVIEWESTTQLKETHLCNQSFYQEKTEQHKKVHLISLMISSSLICKQIGLPLKRHENQDKINP